MKKRKEMKKIVAYASCFGIFLGGIAMALLCVFCHAWWSGLLCLATACVGAWGGNKIEDKDCEENRQSNVFMKDVALPHLPHR